MDLNKNQQLAVSHTSGPVLIIAGAGTGKTSVIVERIKTLLLNGTAPDKILALTFTEKAANEMVERVSLLTHQSLLSLPIYTYNGFGASLLEEFAVDIGLSSHMRLLGETAQLIFLRDYLDDLRLDYFSPVSRPDSQLVHLRDYFSKLKQQVVTPSAYTSYVKTMPSRDEAERLEKQKHSELAYAYETYIELCKKEHVLDYDDQIYASVQLLKDRPNIQNILKKRYDYVIVDEFQDTNPMQSELLERIVNDTSNIMVVGDDDQSIYGWRGATLTNILEFSHKYPHTQNIVLQDNYRSTQPILDAAYAVIQNNNPHRLEHMTGLNKKLISHKSGIKKPEVHHFEHILHELEWIATDIQKRIAKGQKPESIGILARRNSDLALIHDSLVRADVPHVVIGTSTNVFDTLAVKQLIHILQAVHDPHSNTALYHALSSSVFTIQSTLLAKASHEAKQTHESLCNVLTDTQDESVQHTLQLLTHWSEMQKTHTIGEIAYAIVSETAWTHLLYEQALHDNESAIQLQGLGVFFDLLADFTKTSLSPTLAMFIDSLPLISSTIQDIKDDQDLSSQQQVSVLSIHKAKGLEWDTVYLFNCTDGTLPSRAHKSSLAIPETLITASEADEHVAEERRLMYVAMTRASTELTISYADTKTGITKTKPSRFIAEIGEALMDVYHHAQESSIAITLPANSKSQGSIALPSDILQGDTIVLNVTQVATWLKCPEDFYYLYVLKTPQAPNPALTYGTLIHSCIEQMHRAKMSNTSLTLQELLDKTKEQWPHNGYSSALQRQRAHAQGVKTLSLLYERFFSKDSHTPIQSEFPFKIHLKESGVTINGRIDAIYQDTKGVVIVDYKTGTSVTSPEKAKQRATSSKQLTLYALAWQQLRNELPYSLQLDFVETGQIGAVARQQKSIDTILKDIDRMAHDLRRGIYSPGASHEFCEHPH